MIESFSLHNVGPIPSVHAVKPGRINLIIGRNGTGKTFLIKTLYAAHKTIELSVTERLKSKNPEDVLSEKLLNTFDVSTLKELVTRGGSKKLEVKIKTEKHGIAFSFGDSANSRILPSNFNIDIDVKSAPTHLSTFHRKRCCLSEKLFLHHAAVTRWGLTTLTWI